MRKRLAPRLAFALTLALLGSELAWRVYTLVRLSQALATARAGHSRRPYYRVSADLGVEFVPEKFIEEANPFRPGATYRFHINRHGFRGPEVADRPAPGVLRIACLGGSTTFGSGSTADEFSYPARLEHHLNAAAGARRYEVLNCGVPGYTSAHSFINLKLKVAPLQPKVVVVYHLINDLRVNGAPTAFYRQPDGHRFAIEDLPEVEKWRRRSGRFLLEHAWLRARGERPLPRTGVTRAPQALSADGERYFLENLDRIRLLCEGQGATMVLLTFETFVNRPIGQAERQRVEASPSYRNVGLDFETLCAGIARYNDALRGWAVARGVFLCEIDRRLPHEEGIWDDFVHLNDRGAELQAAELARQLGPFLAERFPAE